MTLGSPGMVRDRRQSLATHGSERCDVVGWTERNHCTWVLGGRWLSDRRALDGKLAACHHPRVGLAMAGAVDAIVTARSTRRRFAGAILSRKHRLLANSRARVGDDA